MEKEIQKMDSSEYVKIWIHQSNLMWSRIKTLTALNLAGLAGWRATINEDGIPSYILFSVCFLNLIIFFLMMRDKEYSEWIEDETDFPKVDCINPVFKSKFLVSYAIIPLILIEIVLAIFYTPSFPPWKVVSPEQSKIEEIQKELELSNEAIRVLEELQSSR